MIPADARISISNIAWPHSDDDEALTLVRDLGFQGIEVAPGKVISGVDAVKEMLLYRDRVGSVFSLNIVAFQSIIFDVDDVALFGTCHQRKRLSDHLTKIAQLAGAAGAGACVFGAPNVRVRGRMDEASAFDMATTFFHDIAAKFEDEGVVLTIEANAVHYGCDFITRTDEAKRLVEAVNRAGVRLQIDTGTLILNGEAAHTIERVASMAAHFHASEPDLQPIGSKVHSEFGGALLRSGYGEWRSVEMRANPSWRTNVRNAARVMVDCYA